MTTFISSVGSYIGRSVSFVLIIGCCVVSDDGFSVEATVGSLVGFDVVRDIGSFVGLIDGYGA